MAIVFGPRGFFGYGAITSSNVSGSNSYSQPAGSPFGPLAFWSSTEPRSDVPSSTTLDKAAIRTGLRERYRNYSDPVVQRILAQPNLDIHSVYPTYTTPPLPTWTNNNNNIVLVGDAAHALSPLSGQGVSQGLEDAQALALFLAHYLDQAYAQDRPSQDAESNAIRSATKLYVNLRKPRIERIAKNTTDTGGQLQEEMNFWQEWMMYIAIWLMGALYCNV